VVACDKWIYLFTQHLWFHLSCNFIVHTAVELQTVSVAPIRTSESEVHVDYVSPVLCSYWQEMCHFTSACVANRWLPMLPTLVDMTSSLWTHHQTNWCVRSAFLYLVLPTKWHAVGGSTAKPAWINTRNAPGLAQTAGKEGRTFPTPEASELQWNDIGS